MGRSGAKTFNATLESLQNGLNWVVARVPFDVAEAWPVRRGTRVHGTLNEVPIKTSLMPFPGGQGHFLLVNRKMQAAAGVTVGSRVRIRLEPDMEERPALVPLELERALKADRRLRHWFDSLGESLRRDVGKWVAEPKGEDARRNRGEQTAEWLLLAMEGEAETPPILKAAFQRQPLAQRGWEAMTPAARRRHLLGIFHIGGVAARDRRAAETVKAALAVAARKKL